MGEVMDRVERSLLLLKLESLTLYSTELRAGIRAIRPKGGSIGAIALAPGKSNDPDMRAIRHLEFLEDLSRAGGCDVGEGAALGDQENRDAQNVTTMQRFRKDLVARGLRARGCEERDDGGCAVALVLRDVRNVQDARSHRVVRKLYE
jgi:hypothetical protein